MIEKTTEWEENLTPEEILKAALPPVNFIPNMETVFKSAEAFQQEVNDLSCTGTKNSMTELYAVTRPAVELALATLAGSVNLKATMDDFFTAPAA